MKQKKGFWQGALFGALVVILAGVIVSCGLKLNNDTVVSKDAEKKLETIKNIIDQKYIGDVKEEKLEEGLYRGYIDGLGDPYSVYFNEEETKDLMEMTTGEYSGIGAVLMQERETGIVHIVRVYENSPAMKAGLKDEDILYKVEGEEVTGEDLTEVVKRVKGEKGTEVNLTVLRGKKNKEIELTAVRDIIEAQTVEHRMLEHQIGYVAVSEFDEVTLDQYKEAIQALEKDGMEALVVDLRNNPGGNLNTVCDMLDYMLPEGLVVYTEDKEGKRQEMKSDEKNQFTKPVAVLVNGYSASASEIYAGAMQDYEAGIIVGTQTFGKGVVQRIYDLKNGTCMKLTVSEYFTPKGRNINGKGITPDVEVEYELDENDLKADNQLDKAIEVLKKELNK